MIELIIGIIGIVLVSCLFFRTAKETVQMLFLTSIAMLILGTLEIVEKIKEKK